MVIGIADSGVDDDRLAPRQAPLLHLSAGGKPTATGSARARHRGRQPARRQPAGRRRRRHRPRRDAALGAHRPSRTSCSEAGARARARGGARLAAPAGRAGRQRLGDGGPSRALIDSLRALQLSGALVVAAVGNGGASSRRHVPGVAARRARRRRAGAGLVHAGLVAIDARARRSISWRRRRASRSSRRASASSSVETAITPAGTSFSAPLVTGRGRDGLGDASRLDGGRGRAMRSCAAPRRSAAARRAATGATAGSTCARALRTRPRPRPARAQRLGRRRARPAPAAPGRGRRREPRLGGRPRRRLHGRRARRHDRPARCCARAGGA